MFSQDWPQRIEPSQAIVLSTLQGHCTVPNLNFVITILLRLLMDIQFPYFSCYTDEMEVSSPQVVSQNAIQQAKDIWTLLLIQHPLFALF